MREIAVDNFALQLLMVRLQEEALAAEKENAALLLTKADRSSAEHNLLSDTLACARACFCHAHA